jgi:hypothetical protein
MQLVEVIEVNAGSELIQVKNQQGDVFWARRRRLRTVKGINYLMNDVALRTAVARQRQNREIAADLAD